MPSRNVCSLLYGSWDRLGALSHKRTFPLNNTWQCTATPVLSNMATAWVLKFCDSFSNNFSLYCPAFGHVPALHTCYIHWHHYHTGSNMRTSDCIELWYTAIKTLLKPENANSTALVKSIAVWHTKHSRNVTIRTEMCTPVSTSVNQSHLHSATHGDPAVPHSWTKKYVKYHGQCIRDTYWMMAK